MKWKWIIADMDLEGEVEIPDEVTATATQLMMDKFVYGNAYIGSNGERVDPVSVSPSDFHPLGYKHFRISPKGP